MWAAKDGAPTFCVRDECEGWKFVNPPFAAAISQGMQDGHVGRKGWGTHGMVGDGRG
jgi:hypothetical protein